MQPEGPLAKVISIHAPRVGSDWVDPVLIYWVPISIHAPRVGSDTRSPASDFALSISIHAPRVGSDRGHDLHKVRHRAFQSTLPVWGSDIRDGFLTCV